VDGDLVFECHYSKISAAEFWNHSPEPISVVLLPLGPQRPLDNRDAPLATQVWALSKNFAFEVFREAIPGSRNEHTLTVASSPFELDINPVRVEASSPQIASMREPNEQKEAANTHSTARQTSGSPIAGAERIVISWRDRSCRPR